MATKKDSVRGSLIGGTAGNEALAVSVYCALRYEHDFDGCMIAAVNHNGDSDSIGAVAGNIVGAIVRYETIPDKWKTISKCFVFCPILEIA